MLRIGSALLAFVLIAGSAYAQPVPFSNSLGKFSDHPSGFHDGISGEGRHDASVPPNQGAAPSTTTTPQAAVPGAARPNSGGARP